VGPQRPPRANTQAANSPRAQIHYGQLPPSPVIYSRLPNAQAAQPQLRGVRQFNALAKESPAKGPSAARPGATPQAQFQRQGNLNLVDAAARTLYGRNLHTNSAGRNTLNRIATNAQHAAANPPRQYTPPAANNANASRRPYIHTIPRNLTRIAPN